ncbi:hypothetical protein, partial [Weizmannia agrestimuris]|uniref:hypothetical protein n=1 Tax=Weizmannia agrestimuris TaxID=2941342 RepID=UPI0020409930
QFYKEGENSFKKILKWKNLRAEYALIVSSFQIIESKSTLDKPLKLSVIKLKDSPKVECASEK